MKVGYVRVSTVEQNEARQIEGLQKYGIDRWYIEKVSGKNTNRAKLQEMISALQSGDTVYIHDFSRLARSTSDLLKMVEELNGRGIHLVSNKENIDTSTPTGKLMLTMIGAINEFERTNMLERQKEGIAIAKRENKYKNCGRKKKELDGEYESLIQSYVDGEISKVQLAVRQKRKRQQKLLVKTLLERIKPLSPL